MQISLFDSVESLPRDDANHILVYAGRGSLVRGDVTDMVTEIHCTYRVGENKIEFQRNGDPLGLRFEQAFSWAVRYAIEHDIANVYGVFTLNRPLDLQYLTKICPVGITDLRGGEVYKGEHAARAAAPCAERLSAAPASYPASYPMAPRHMVLRHRPRAMPAYAIPAAPGQQAANANSLRAH